MPTEEIRIRFTSAKDANAFAKRHGITGYRLVKKPVHVKTGTPGSGWGRQDFYFITRDV